MATGTKPAPGALSKEIAAILRAQMGRKQVVQARVAEAAGMSQPQLSGVLSEKKQLDIEQLDELCWALGLELREVIAEADIAASDRQSSPEWSAKTVVRD